MSNEEFEFILAALEFIAIYGQRFLPLYHFNLRSGTWSVKKKALSCLMKNNCNVNVLPLANDIEANNMGNDQSKAESKQIGLVEKFAQYLETAMEIAHLLPKFPPKQQLPEELDLNFLHFRI